MTYDLHGGGWENFTGLHTALYARPEEGEMQLTLNQVRQEIFLVNDRILINLRIGQSIIGSNKECQKKKSPWV